MHATVDVLQCGTHHIYALHINALAPTRNGISRLSNSCSLCFNYLHIFARENFFNLRAWWINANSSTLKAHPSTKMKSKLSGRTRTGCSRVYILYPAILVKSRSGSYYDALSFLRLRALCSSKGAKGGVAICVCTCCCTHYLSAAALLDHINPLPWPARARQPNIRSRTFTAPHRAGCINRPHF